MKKKYKILLSAYACEPNRGSEPGVGWNWVLQIARFHEVWVITRANNKQVIEAELAVNPLPNVHFIYYDLPAWLKWFKKGNRGVHWYYYLWQIGIYRLARQFHRQVGFDIVQHVTFVNYWMPSFLAFLPAKFIWGPVGGGDATPGNFISSISLRGQIYERARNLATSIFEWDPFVRMTARRAAVTLAVTHKTQERIRKIGGKEVRLLSQVGLSGNEIKNLQRFDNGHSHPFRLISIGNLLHLKGFHLGLAAFAKSLNDIAPAEYWLIGDGPERDDLEKLVNDLDLNEQVKFFGSLPRSKTLQKLGEASILLHPSMHDSGAIVCAEAMGAGLPVICLKLGGPALQVTSETGFAIEAETPEQVVDDLANVIIRLSNDEDMLRHMGDAGRERVGKVFNWESKGEYISNLYDEVLS